MTKFEVKLGEVRVLGSVEDLLPVVVVVPCFLIVFNALEDIFTPPLVIFGILIGVVFILLKTFPTAFFIIAFVSCTEPFKNKSAGRIKTLPVKNGFNLFFFIIFKTSPIHRFIY